MLQVYQKNDYILNLSTWIFLFILMIALGFIIGYTNILLSLEH